MSLFNSSQMELLTRYLDLTATRQSLVTGNIANVDTPGYRTRDIDFHGELQRALQGDGSETTEPVAREVQGLIARPDGNNVSIDRESMLLSEVQLEFSSAELLLKSEFKTLNLAINEGNGAI
jgi:flagellar basal-body rod protein FlgB